jgi:hypothetical protein
MCLVIFGLTPQVAKYESLNGTSFGPTSILNEV